MHKNNFLCGFQKVRSHLQLRDGFDGSREMRRGYFNQRLRFYLFCSGDGSAVTTTTNKSAPRDLKLQHFTTDVNRIVEHEIKLPERNSATSRHRLY